MAPTEGGSGPAGAAVEFVLDGRAVAVEADGSLLDSLRGELGVTTVKDGCSPQGQCGCCTVLVDGQPRVACVTPVTRVRGRAITTVDGLADAQLWGDGFCAAGASQCGFCTPGIVVRVAAMDDARRREPDAVRRALLAHLCRCTGWQPIIDAVTAFPAVAPARRADAIAAAEQRAAIEGGVAQTVGPQVALGRGGFADDTAPPDALVALRGADGEWVVGDDLADARRRSGKVQGRRTTAPLVWPLAVPAGAWQHTLRTTWVEPAYLEPDAAWCVPGGEPSSPLGNGGAFGGKVDARLGRVARELADRHGRAVRVLDTREDVVRFGPKRPPVAAGVAADGTGELHAVRTPGLAERVAAVAPGITVVEHTVPGPPTSIALRGAGSAEAAILLASLQAGPEFTVTTPNGASATARVDADGVKVRVRCGVPLDDVVLRSYCTGAAHMALGWVRSEAIAVDRHGEPHDLTIRSFGVLRAVDTPPITVSVEPADGDPVNGSDAVFAAVATAAWHADGWAADWPTRR